MVEVEMEPTNVPEQIETNLVQAERVSAWKRWRKTIAIGSGLIVLVLFIIAGAIIAWQRSFSSQNSALQEKSKSQERQALYYMKTLDPNVQPCEDFYAFACENLKHEYAKENKYRFDTMDMMEKRARVSLNDFLTKPLNTSDSETLRQLKIFQQMCINKTKIETEGIEPVLTLLNEIGGWPLLTNYSENNESWEQIVGSVNRAGFATFFPYHLQPSNLISLSPLLDPIRPRVLPDEERTTDYMKLVASLLNATNDQIDDDIRNCIDFESELQELTNSVVQDGEIHTLESLITDYPEIAWETFFRNAFISNSIEVSRYEIVLLSHSKYNVKVSELLNKTSAKIIRNYVVWRLIEEAIPLMPEKFREAKNAFEQRTAGKSRNLDCADALIDKAKVSIGYLYIKNYFDVLAKNKSHGMLKSIERQAYRFLKNIKWMDNNTNTKIVQTLEKLKIALPQPNNPAYLWEDLDFRSNATIFANYRRLAETHRSLERSRVRMSQKDHRQTIPLMYAVYADAYFSLQFNEVYMLAAIFQPPVFFVDQPMYLNYGGIGFIIANAMTNAMQLLSVCENEACPSFDRFQERKDCMEKLYGGYVLKQLNETVDGKRTAVENIGDLIGLKLSYRAYEEFAKDSEEQLLPGLSYTARQWFWINAATTFCSYESDAALRDIIKTNEHSPAEARINVAFANTEEFSRDFQCPIGSRMNPVRKCGFQ